MGGTRRPSIGGFVFDFENKILKKREFWKFTWHLIGRLTLLLGLTHMLLTSPSRHNFPLSWLKKRFMSTQLAKRGLKGLSLQLKSKKENTENLISSSHLLHTDYHHPHRQLLFIFSPSPSPNKSPSPTTQWNHHELPSDLPPYTNQPPWAPHHNNLPNLTIFNRVILFSHRLSLIRTTTHHKPHHTK